MSLLASQDGLDMSIDQQLASVATQSTVRESSVQESSDGESSVPTSIFPNSELPTELKLHIVGYLCTASRKALRLVNRNFEAVTASLLLRTARIRVKRGEYLEDHVKGDSLIRLSNAVKSLTIDFCLPKNKSMCLFPWNRVFRSHGKAEDDKTLGEYQHLFERLTSLKALRSGHRPTAMFCEPTGPLRLQTFLHAASNLRRLNIYLRFTYGTVAYTTITAPFLVGPYWPFLESVSLSYMILPADILLDFMRSHASTLRAVEIVYVVLEPGRQAPTWDDVISAFATDLQLQVLIRCRQCKCNLQFN